MLRSSAAGLPLSAVHPWSGSKADSRQLPVHQSSAVGYTCNLTDSTRFQEMPSACNYALVALEVVVIQPVADSHTQDDRFSHCLSASSLMLLLMLGPDDYIHQKVA